MFCITVHDIWLSKTYEMLLHGNFSLVAETNLRSSDEDVFVSGQVSDLNLQLIQEQRLRLSLEERLRSMESQLASASSTSATTTTTPVAAPSTIIKRLPVRIYFPFNSASVSHV